MISCHLLGAKSKSTNPFLKTPGRYIIGSKEYKKELLWRLQKKGLVMCNVFQFPRGFWITVTGPFPNIKVINFKFTYIIKDFLDLSSDLTIK